ncbi:uncharacterized protein GGS25DRAFT_523392 [Hypoxylon fragiforme]|uniref:uncharacterized protein n=1 Tax=Hypoxylon fragiforme TaxID=63214 RepID=UPI0020C74679|nr:uncharacterized protein GGS25DRAFT_523392 [Hypoxylon fragiforme]KAI2605722.1 hypothetical protein GGS25DRAFT_523392 [Hypoxylon fragiforme]
MSIEPDAHPRPFPQDLPPRPEPPPSSSWRTRSCPGFRSCWSFSWHAYSLATPDSAVLARRACMIITLAARTGLSVWGVVFGAYSAAVVGTVVGIVLAVVGFLFIAWCLAQVGEVEGRRIVLGAGIDRWHFDIFLIFSALIHIGALIGVFTGMGQTGFLVIWYGMWLLLFAAAWITTWDPVPLAGSYV